jgi:CheY-like chemotaxis protein
MLCEATCSDLTAKPIYPGIRATDTPSPRAYEDFMNAVWQSGYGADNSRLSKRLLLLRSNDLQRSSRRGDRDCRRMISNRGVETLHGPSMLDKAFTLRPCFLVVDREFSGKIPTRKLIIETAKFNVIRAYSGVEAIESVQNFPSLDGMVLDAGLSDRPADEVVRELKKLQPTLPIVVICAPGADECPGRNITCSLSIRLGYSSFCRASGPRRPLLFGSAIRNSAKKKRNRLAREKRRLWSVFQLSSSRIS